MIVHLHGGKADQMGKYGYSKRFAPNWLCHANCFVTAVGRILFSRDADNDSSYLYMTEKEAERYEATTKAKIAKNTRLENPVRVRGNGPHTRFGVHFKRTIKKQIRDPEHCHFSEYANLALAPHSFKRTAYRRLQRMEGVTQQDVNGRADHHTGMVFIYGQSASGSDDKSGGPSERHDMSMSKQLANFDFKHSTFNQNPPHFSDTFILEIEWVRFLPCFPHLKENIVELLPLILALLLHHYHDENGIAWNSLGNENPFRFSPLWNDVQCILYRHYLYENLKGAGHGDDAIDGTSELRNMGSDAWCMQVASLRCMTAVLENQRTMMQPVGGSVDAEACVVESRYVLSQVTGDKSYISPNVALSVSSNRSISAVRSNPSPSSVSLQVQRQIQRYGVLQQAEPAFKIPATINCKTAFHRMHTKGVDKDGFPGLWREKTGDQIDPSLDAKERKSMREHFNKILPVCKMLLGSNSIADVINLGVHQAWTLCKQKVNAIWRNGQGLQCDILGGEGDAAVRTVYNIMNGHDTSMTKEECASRVQECMTTAMPTRVQIQQTLSFNSSTSNVDEDQINCDDADPDQCVLTDPNDCAAHVLDIDDTVECYVCERCVPPRLVRDWSDWTHCTKQHLNLGAKDTHYFGQDEVRTVRAKKSNPAVKTSKYVACGNPTYKQFSIEERRTFLRHRIIQNGLLKKGDRIQIKFDESGQDRFALVVSGVLALNSKSWSVEVALLNPQNILLLDSESTDTQFIWVNSILAICPKKIGRNHSPAPSSPLDGVRKQQQTQSTLNFFKNTSGNAALNSPPKRSKVAPSAEAAAKGAAKAPMLKDHITLCNLGLASEASTQLPDGHQRESISTSSQTILPRSVTAAAASVTTQPRRTLRFDTDPKNLAPIFVRATESVTPKNFVAPPKPASELRPSEYKLNIGASIMLRDVAEFGTCLRVPISYVTGTKNYVQHAELRFNTFQYKTARFIEDDYGLKFCSIYPNHVQKVLHAFNLDEGNRCFFLALGIATNTDPFSLQCLFRTHASFLHLNKDSLMDSVDPKDEHNDDSPIPVIKILLDEILDLTKRDAYIDCSFLRFLWPTEFDKFQIVIIVKRGGKCFQQIYNASETVKRIDLASDAGSSKTTIFLKLESNHYTVLTLLDGHVDLDHCAQEWLLHEFVPDSRCPSIETMHFDTHADETTYVATAIEGNVPTEQEVDKLWTAITSTHGIKYNEEGKMFDGWPLGIDCTNANQQGSLRPQSWDIVRNALVHKFWFDKVAAGKDKAAPDQRTRANCFSPAQGNAVRQSTSTEVPFVFLDVGSESGRGLVRMLHDDRITHAAGVELQTPWFQLSVTLFQDLRKSFVQHGFKLPSITLIRSDMLAATPILAYIYGITSISLMNNEVFDKHNTFIAHPGPLRLADDVRNAPLYLYTAHPGRKLLSANAACALSKYFQNTTCIALFQPEHFNEQFDYLGGKIQKVESTWGIWAECNVTIKTHTQHVKIDAANRLPCASQSHVSLWHHYMRMWSESLAQLHVTMRQDVIHTPKDSSKLAHCKVQHSVDVDSEDSDLELEESELAAAIRVLQCDPSKSSVRYFNFPQLATLQPRRMLDESILDHYMHLLTSQFPDTMFPTPMLSVYRDMMLKSKTSSAKKKFCEKYIFKKAPTDDDTLVFAMNPGIHWIAFKVDMSKKYIATMCSLNNSLKDEAEILLDLISSIHGAAKTFQHFSVTVPYQKNPLDCGPLCCMFMLFLAQNHISKTTKLEYDTEPTATAMRMRIFADIAMKKITTL